MAKIKVAVKSAFAVDGTVYRPGQTVSVEEKVARNLIDRGKVTVTEGKAPEKPKGPIGTDGKGGAKPQGEKPADEGK